MPVKNARLQTLLLIEDNLDNRDLIYALIEGRFDIESVADGFAALEVLGQGGDSLPDVVLCDIALPGMDGVELLRRLRAVPGLRQLPVVALTSHAMKGDREHFLEVGFDAYLSKPILEPELLDAAIEQGVTSARARG